MENRDFKAFGKKIDPIDYLDICATRHLSFHFGQSAEDAILLRLFSGKQLGFYIDIGAFHSRKYSNTYVLNKYFGWKGINIDASSKAIEGLKIERPEDINLHCAIGAQRQPLKLTIYDRPARNTVSPENRLRQNDKGLSPIGEEDVEAMPLSDIIHAHLPENQIVDLMNIDIEGSDLAALETNDWDLCRPRVILVEDYSVLKDGPGKSEIYNFLSSKGYHLCSHCYDTSFYITHDFFSSIDSSAITRNFNFSRNFLRDSIPEILSDTRVLCSHIVAPEKLENAKIKSQYEKLQLDRRQLQSEYGQLEAQYKQLEEKLTAIEESTIWRGTKPIRDLKKSARSLIRFVRSIRSSARNYGIKKTLKNAIELLQRLLARSRDHLKKNPLETLLAHRLSNKQALQEAYQKSNIANMPDTFALYRIIGNDLFPRHKKGQSRKNLRFVLENEKPLPDCEKYWIVNRIIDNEEEKKIIQLLEKHQQNYIHIPFDAEEYKKAGWATDILPQPGYLSSEAFESLEAAKQDRLRTALYRHKNNYVMNNNGARNIALRDGLLKAKWVLPWDGNCFLTPQAWQAIVATVTSQPYLKYFAVPMDRIMDNADLLRTDYQPNPVEEPQLIFRCDSQESFNEAHPYGRRPKVELFWRLGIPGPWDGWADDPWDQPRREKSPEYGQFGTAGWVARMFSGVKELESQSDTARKSRYSKREEAIRSAIDYIDVKITNTCQDYAPVKPEKQKEVIEATTTTTKKKLILHAGTHKTGTTAIQSFAVKNKEHLLAQGLHYPDYSPMPFHLKDGHHRFGHAFSDVPDKKMSQEQAETLARIWSDVATTLDLTTLISVEATYRHTVGSGDWKDSRRAYLSRLSNTLSGFDTEVILVFRRPDDFAKSLYLENIATGTRYIESFESWLSSPKSYLFSYADSARIFEEFFGKVTCYIYEDIGKNGGLIKNFFSALSVDVSGLSGSSVVRKSLSPLEAQAKNFANSLDIMPREGRELVDWIKSEGFSSALKKEYGDHKYDVWQSAQQRKDFLSLRENDISDLSQQYFGGKEIFDLSPSDSLADPVPDLSENIKELVRQQLLKLRRV